MAVEQDGGVLDKDRVWIVRELRQPHDLEPGIDQRLLIGGVLARRLFSIDRSPLEVGQLAFGEPRADGAGEGFHWDDRTMRPPFMTKRMLRTALTSRVGSPSTAMRSARRPGFTWPRSVRRRMRALPEVAVIMT